MACYLGFRASDNPKYYFLSYNSEDADRVGEIAGQMSRAGIELWYDKGIEYGEKWERTIAEKIYGCQAVVLFFTRGILDKEDSFAEKEYKMARTYRKKVYVVMMDEIEHRDVPTGKMFWWNEIMELQCIEAHVIDDPDRMVEEIISALTVKREQGTCDARNDSANTELRSTYGANGSTTARIPYVSKRSMVKSLTPYIPLIPEVGLIGRDDIVDRVRTMLDSEKSVALISGLGGIGKTAVMAQICNSIMSEGRQDTYVAWITCGESYIDDLLTLRQQLGIPKDIKREEAYEAVIGKLQDLQGTLYIFFDDMARVPDKAELGTYNALRPNVRIMITSRHEIKGIPHVDLKELERDPAVDMFCDYYRKDTERKYAADAWKIIHSDSVRSHTLLVELLAKAANASFGSLADFRKRLEKEGFLNVSQRKFDTGHFDNKTIEESVTQLYGMSHLSEEQQRIMRLFSIFTPEKVIYGAIEAWAAFDADAVDGLVRLGWLDRAENGFVIHQIIRDSLAEQVGGSLRIGDYGNLLKRVIDTDDYMPRDLEYTEVQERLVLTTDIAGYLWTRVEGSLETEHHPKEYKELLTNSGTLFNNMAGVFRAQGEYEKALEYYGKALEIKESVFGAEHPYTATTYNNMALVFRAQGEYEKALEYYGKALEIKESVFGAEHPYTGATYNNMALVFRAQGEYEKALEYYEKDLAIGERVFGAEHPYTATTYNNIAGVYEDQGDYEKALKYYGKAMSIRERVLGPEHPSTATTYNNMALVYSDQGDYEKALEYYGKALSIRERVLGTEHPSTAATYHNMAGVYSYQGEYEKALEYYGKAMSIRERVLGPEHPSTATTYNNIARVFRAQGDYAKALMYYEKALAVRKAKLGEAHPYTQNTQRSVQKMEQIIKRKSFFRRIKFWKA